MERVTRRWQASTRTSYLWEDVLAKDSLLDILHRFVQFIPYKNDSRKNKLIFPRYHQLDAVRALVADAKANGAGKNYLVQHSAGSGKSNTIAWLAHHYQIYMITNSVLSSTQSS